MTLTVVVVTVIYIVGGSVCFVRKVQNAESLAVMIGRVVTEGTEDREGLGVFDE
jgi:hypothetical protein